MFWKETLANTLEKVEAEWTWPNFQTGCLQFCYGGVPVIKTEILRMVLTLTIDDGLSTATRRDFRKAMNENHSGQLRFDASFCSSSWFHLWRDYSSTSFLFVEEQEAEVSTLLREAALFTEALCAWGYLHFVVVSLNEKCDCFLRFLVKNLQRGQVVMTEGRAKFILSLHRFGDF